MKAEEFKQYEGKETFGTDECGWNFDNGVIVAMVPEERQNKQELITKLPDASGLQFTYLIAEFEKIKFMSKDEETLFMECEEGADYSYLFCRRENVKFK